MNKKIKRRSFLKYTAAGVSALALEHYLSPLLSARPSEDRPYVNRSTGKAVKGIPSACAGCGAGCGIVAYVQDGQLMKISGNPAHPVNKGALCLIGQAGIYTLYDPERTTKPLMRTGSRGQGRWKEISWGEAATVMAERLKKLGRKGIALETRGGGSEAASVEFLSKAGGGTLVSHGYVVSPNREAAMNGTFGVPYDIPDIANTDYILNFGANPYESDPLGVGAVSAMTQRRADNSSVKLVTFDPRLSATAGRSDEWLPLLPGTDAVVALAMASVIMHEGLYDKAFMERNTNVTPARLKDHLSDYTPSVAERISGVNSDDIRRIAAEYARADRAVLLTGGGVSKHSHGTSNERAVRLLSIITGKVDRPGCNILARDVRQNPPAPGVNTVAPEKFYLKLKDNAQRLGVYIIHGCDPVYSAPAGEQVAKTLADERAVPFIVCMDTHVTDTGLFADLVLPMATYLEEYAVEQVPAPGAQPVINLRQPVVPSVGESRPYVDVLAMVSARSGARLSFSGSEDYAEAAASAVEGLSKFGGMDQLAKTGFYYPSKHGPGETRQAAKGFGTPSKKVEVLWKDGPRLPVYDQPAQYKNLKDDEFVMVKYNPVGYREGFTENNLLLKELNHSNKAFINSEVGRAIGLKSMGKAMLRSAAGEMEVEVMLSPGVHPRTVAIAAGCGHEGYGNIENAKRFESADPFTNSIWWVHEGEGKGVNPNRIIPFDIDPASGGQGWMLTKVTIEKA